MMNQDPTIAQELLSHQAFLRRLAVDLVGRDADDLVQDVWQRALDRPPHHGNQLRGWLARVARNLAANRWRGEARRAEREEGWASEQGATEDLEARHELRKELVEALDSLGQSCRGTILLRYFEGLAPGDIARRQGVPVATVKTRLRRGLGQLREVLDKRNGGDRATWMSAVTALAAPVGSGVGTGALAGGTLVIGGMALGTMTKVSAAVLVAAVVVSIVARTSLPEAPPEAAAELPATDVELVGAGSDGDLVDAAAGDPVTEAVRQHLVEEERPDGVPAVTGTNVLRVVLEGITEEEAPSAKVMATAVDEREETTAEIRDSWPCQGSTSEFDLDPFLAQVARRAGAVRVDELEVAVDHPAHFLETTRVRLSDGVELTTGQILYEVRMPLVPPVFWPELTLHVRDAETGLHLENVELCSASPGLMGIPRQPGTLDAFTSLGGGLSSPIVLRGGREASDPEHRVAGLELRPAGGQAPQLVELWHNGRGRGVMLYARSPGYTWGSTVLEVSTGAEYEILLRPAAALHVRLMNVQLEGYALHEMPAYFGTWFRAEGQESWFWADEGSPIVRRQQIDERLETEWLRLEGLDPGEHLVLVQLGGPLWPGDGPVLAREELTLAAGETRELVLELADPPPPPVRAALGGVVSFPAFGGSNLEGEEKVRLQFYSKTSWYREPDVELTLADMERVGGALPTWSFRVENLPVGRYRLQLLPFLKNALIELPVSGLEGVELVVPELAEVLVETVDERTGEPIPLDEFYYRNEEPLPGQETNDWARAHPEEPGRFRIWTRPGATSVWSRNAGGLGYTGNGMALDLVSGFQSVRLELAPMHALRFEFREDGAVLPFGDHGLNVHEDIRAVGHEGRVTSDRFQEDMHVQVSAPGVYEIDFEGMGVERYHPIPPRRVEVRPGETAEVIVELRRK